MKKLLLSFLSLIVFSCSVVASELPVPKAGTVKTDTADLKNNDDSVAIQKKEVDEKREQARFFYNANNLEKSSELFNTIPENYRNSDDYLLLANISQDTGKVVDAVFYLKKAIQLNKKNYKAHYNLGLLYYADNKINMALSEFKKASNIKKDFAYAYYNMGCCYLKKKSYFNAKYMFGLAIKYSPNEPDFYYNLAYTYKMQKKEKKAKEAIDMYTKIMTDS